MGRIPVAVPIRPKVGVEVWDPDFKLGWELPRDEVTPEAPDSQAGQATPISHYLSKTKEAILDCLSVDHPQTAEQLVKSVKVKHGVECEEQTVRKYMGPFKKAKLVARVKQGYVLLK